MSKKTVLLIDDEQSFLEPLADALEFEGFRVLKARTATEGLSILEHDHIDLVTIDIMLDPGNDYKDHVASHNTGIFLCEEIRRKHPLVDAFCLSVISDSDMIKKIQSLGIRFLRKGETPLRTVLNLLRSKLTGIAYSTERDGGKTAKSHQSKY